MKCYFLTRYLLKQGVINADFIIRFLLIFEIKSLSSSQKFYYFFQIFLLCLPILTHIVELNGDAVLYIQVLSMSSV